MPPAGSRRSRPPRSACRPQSRGDVVQHPPGHLRMRHRPGDLHRHVRAQPVRHQHGGAGGVGIDVEIDLLALRRAASMRGRVSTERPKFSGIEHLWWLITTGAPTSRPIFSVSSIDCSTSFGLVAHMRDVEAAGGAQRLGHRDHLVGRRMHVGRVVEAGGEAGGAFAPAPRPGARCMCVGFLVGGGALRVAVHRFDAQRHVADQRHGVHRRRVARQALGVFAEAVEGPPAFVAQQIERRQRAATSCAPARG